MEAEDLNKLDDLVPQMLVYRTIGENILKHRQMKACFPNHPSTYSKTVSNEGLFS